MDNFRIEVPGKWILAGEHAVLRGQPAIALPHSEYRLVLEYEKSPDSGELQIYPVSISEEVATLLDLLHERWGQKQSQGRIRTPLAGTLRLKSNIPLQAGFGSSAAFCYATAVWFDAIYGIEDKNLVEVASRLEDHFHGKSSGLDVAVVASQTPILYSRGACPRKLELSKLPRFTFHDSGVRAATQACIAKVEAFISRNASLGKLYDEKMGASTQIISNALVEYSDHPECRELVAKQIADAMNHAQECFYAWDLVPDEVKAVENRLRNEGAIGIKLTGGGGGGFLVAMWAD